MYNNTIYGIYIVLFEPVATQSALQLAPHIHPFIVNGDSGVNHAREQPARREQLGLGVLLRDTSTLGGAGDRQPAPPPEPLPPL